MKHRMTYRFAAASLAVALSLADARRACMPSAPTRADREPVTLNFVNADIEAVARAMAAITGRNIVVDPRVKGTITLYTDEPLPPRAAYQPVPGGAARCGFTVVESGGLLKVVPEADAKLQAGTVSRRARRPARRPDRHADLPPQLRERQQPGAGAAAADQPQQHDQRQSRQQLAGDHRLRRQPAAHRHASSRRWTCPNATDVEVIPLQHAVAVRHRAGGAAAGRHRRRSRRRRGAAGPGRGDARSAPRCSPSRAATR